ncbi:MAG: DUF4258 domain-containing protein [Aggregatilineales bacterium]
MDAIIRIRRAVRRGKYEFTDHALIEAYADGLRQRDAIDVLLTGALDSAYTDDDRGVRYVIRGDVGQDEVDVVCRFRDDGVLLIIITVYVVDR